LNAVGIAWPKWPRHVNDLANFQDVFRGITPYTGTPPKGFMVDFLGTLTDSTFRLAFGGVPETDGGKPVTTRLPTIEDGEGWFEAANWAEAARAARDRYVMITLGACYGAQAVGAQRALEVLNPLPYRLVAVEPEPDNMKWVRKHFSDNGIDPNQQWLLQTAISDSNEPVYFPIGAPGSGAQNCFSTNARDARAAYFDYFVSSGTAVEALEAMLMQGTTGLKKDLVPGRDFAAEIKAVSSITLADVLSPFDFVDFLEADMQQSEIVVFPPYMELLKQRVRRVHIGTHGGDVHAELAGLLRRDGWSIVFDFAPNSEFDTPIGKFSTNDGVLSAVNNNL
jgi:hypothetical protein